MSNTNNLEDSSLDDLYNELKYRANKVTSNKKGIISRKSSISGVPTSTIVAAVKAKQKVIYGKDDRKDFHEVQDPDILKDIESTVSLFESRNIEAGGDGTSNLNTQKFGDAYDLCSNEKFREQPIGAFCSGFLVAPDIIATAGHCVNANNVQDVRFVFGFRMNSPGNPTTKINNSEIYKGESIIGRELSDDGTDWALVKLDRKVENHPSVKIRKQGKITDNQSVHVIGHPCGLPLKFADNSFVRDNTKPSFMTCNLDTYGGNSGSPVFNSDTHEVEGILVRGETDFEASGNCNISLVCPSTGCRGEDVTRTTEFANLIDTDNK
jgi:V8-like Glu-specific endopeptidase